MILVDTSVWIDYFNGHTTPETDRLAFAIAENQPLVLPGIVLTEILLGLKTDAEAERISQLLEAFQAPPEYSCQDYQEAAHIYRVCRTQGFTIRSTIDCLIAQLCLQHGYTLLTKDKDFHVIARCFPLKLERIAQA